MPSTPDRLDRVLAAAARRLALRRAAFGAGAGGVGGAGVAAAALVARLAGLPVHAAAAVALGAPLLGAATGAAIGALRRGLDRRELALLADRCLGTDEALVTAVHLGGDAPAGLDGARLAADLPLRAPRGLRPALALWAAAVLGTLLAPPVLAPYGPLAAAGDPGAVVQEGEQLEARLAALEASPEGSRLPEALERELSDLADDLQGDTLDADEATRRLAELEQQLERFREELAPSERLLDELEQAARALDADATEALSEALAQGDMAGAADAAGDLAESLAGASPEEQREAAEALQRAGEQLQRSGDPSLQQAGEALEQAGEQLAQQQGQGQAQGQSEGQDPSGGSPPLSPEQAADLQEALERQRDLGERLARDRERLQQAQDMQGAVGGAQERLQAGAGAGAEEGEGEGEGEPAEAMAQGMGGGGGGAGADHTWEDEGEFDPDPSFQDGRSAELRQEQGPQGDAEHIDDFEKFYAPHRLDDVEALLATAEGQLDEAGRIDTLVTRLTESDETAEAPTLDLPTAYREAATEAIEAERIPPAYRDAVKHYFD